MARSLFVLLLLAMVITHSSATSWCICKPGSSESVLQKALDYACGAGADCNPIHEKGGCFNPNTVLAHCNYAVNSYFQKKGQAPGSCDFAGAAAVTPSDPSTAGCVYPASASATPTTTTPNTNTPTTTTTTPSGNSPYVTTPNNGGGGVLGGGVGTGLGPSGVGINNDDDSHGGLTLQQSACGMVYLLAVSIVFYGLIFLWG